MPPKGRNSSGLGRAIINKKTKDSQRGGGSNLYTTEIDTTSKLKSVTQENDLDEFLSTAALAGTEFTAERQNVTIIQDPLITSSPAHNPFLLSAQQEKDTLARHYQNRSRLRIPRRPAWNKSTPLAELEQNERVSFLEWRRQLAALSDQENLLLTPFERNLEVWRQLWRVLERSELVVQIVDARNPLKFRCEDLEKYAYELGEREPSGVKKKCLLVINKSDLLTLEQRRWWADYFDSHNVSYTFYSATTAAECHSREPPDSDCSDHGIELNHEKFNDIDDAKPDPRTKILSAEELLELFVSSAPDIPQVSRDGKLQQSPQLVVGLVGYPNVGKSSTINSLVGAKKVSVSATPGKTKHFQTIQLSPFLVLCDCPGLVFPQFATTKADLVCDGVLPIDQMREYTGPTALVTKRIPREILELTYGLVIDGRSTDGNFEDVSGHDLLVSYAIARGFVRSGQGNPDEARAARYILKDYVNAKLLYCHPIPGMTGDEFNSKQHKLVTHRLKLSGKKRAPATRVSKIADTYIPSFVPDRISEVRNNGQPSSSIKGDTIDSQFFRNHKETPSHPKIEGIHSNVQAFTRALIFPHQRATGEDGRPLHSVMPAISCGGGDDGKKRHKGPKRIKQRSGKGCD